MSLSVFGSNIRMVRMQKGLSVRELDKKVDISYATISNIENGKGSLSFSQRQALCEVLNVSLHEMYSTSIERMEVVGRIVELYNTFKVDNLKQAETICEELIGTLEASEERSDLFNLLGKICIMQGEYTKANESYKKSIDDLKETGLDNSMFYYSYYGYALSFYYLKNHDRVLELAHTAISYESRSQKDVSVIKKLMATSYLEIKELVKAKNILLELLPVYEEINDPYSLCEIHNNLGYMYWVLGEYDTSEDMYSKGITHALKTKYEYYVFKSAIGLIRNYCKLNQNVYVNELANVLKDFVCPPPIEASYLNVVARTYMDTTEKENSLLVALYRSEESKDAVLTKEISEELVRLYKSKGDLEQALYFAELALNSSNIILKQYEKEFCKA